MIICYRSISFGTNDKKNDVKARTSSLTERAFEPSISLDTDELLTLIIMAIMTIPQAPKLPKHIYRLILNPLGLFAAVDVKGGPVFMSGQVDVPIAVGARIGALGYRAGVAIGIRPSIGLDGVKMSAGVLSGFGSKFGSDGEVANGDTPSIQDRKK